MRFHKDNSKDLDSWINLPVKILLNADGFYQGTLIEEMKNGILIKCSGKRVYVPYESILSLEELRDVSKDEKLYRYPDGSEIGIINSLGIKV